MAATISILEPRCVPVPTHMQPITTMDRLVRIGNTLEGLSPRPPGPLKMRDPLLTPRNTIPLYSILHPYTPI